MSVHVTAMLVVLIIFPLILQTVIISECRLLEDRECDNVTQ